MNGEKKLSFVHLLIHFQQTLSPGCGRSIPGKLCVIHPGWYKQGTTDIHNSLFSMFLKGGRKPDNPKKTQIDIGRPCKTDSW